MTASGSLKAGGETENRIRHESGSRDSIAETHRTAMVSCSAELSFDRLMRSGSIIVNAAIIYANFILK